MPRYLTPAKINLLLIIDLYVSDQILASVNPKILGYIASQVILPSDHDNTGIEGSPQSLSSRSDVTTLSEHLAQWTSQVPGRSVYDILLQRVWELNDLDALHVLFQHLGELVAPRTPTDAPGAEGGSTAAAKISRASPLGQYIRRGCVEFTRLQFADVQALWHAFSLYREPSYDVWANRNPEAACQKEDTQPAWASVQTDHQRPNGAYNTSSEDVEMLLSHSVHALQKLGHRVPGELKSQLSHFFEISAETSSEATQSLHHFLAFFEHWRAGQYTMALEALHRYFDYSLVAKGSAEQGGRDIGGAAGTGNVKVYYQYALLHLSVLHADFECWGESVDAMEECIATARENQDSACLNFALSWLLYLRQAHPSNATSAFKNLAQLAGGGEQDEIAFLKAKARDSRQWSLMSSTLLEEAKWDMYGGQADLGKSAYSSVLIPKQAPHVPLGDRLRASCRVAYKLAQSGNFDGAFDILHTARADPRLGGVLKLEQRLRAFEGMLKLRQYIYSGDLDAATYALEQLRPARSMFGDAELSFELSLLEIEVMLKKEQCQKAMHAVNTQIDEQKRSPRADIAHRLHLLVLKARIFASGKQAIKGFSIALRAAAMAERHLLISVLIEALGVLGVILTELGEYEAAREILGAGLPMAIEAGDLSIIARLFSHLAEAHVGIAGYQCEHGSAEQTRNLRTAEAYVDRSFEASGKLGDHPSMQDCLVMKARLAKWHGDESTATQAEEKYEQLLSDMERLKARKGQ
ncbi:APC5 protein [Vermiconidia calcicola]|uniref:APC5 protein n=1 Tax=Vermiconidia calcicola TaxID=1690605 RepID=A0ACC3MB99_9PEZI|nr:APC5 protein [Vermiconidia calcicola]